MSARSLTTKVLCCVGCGKGRVVVQIRRERNEKNRVGRSSDDRSVLVSFVDTSPLCPLIGSPPTFANVIYTLPLQTGSPLRASGVE